MFKRFGVVVAFVTMAACGGGGSGSTKGNESTACVVNAGSGDQTCSAYLDIDSTAAGAANSGCTQSGGTVEGTCPSANLDGCCTFSNSGGNSLVTCYYQNNASSEQSACTGANGTWKTTL